MDRMRLNKWIALLKDNTDTLAAGLFLTLLVSPALLELLILRSSMLRELLVLGTTFLLFLVFAVLRLRRTGIGPRRVFRFLKAGGRLWEGLLLSAWVLFLLIQTVLGRGVNARVPFGYFAFFLAVWLIDLYFAVSGRQDRQRWILYALLAVFAVACLRGMPALAANPDAARLLSTGSIPEADKRLYHLLGVGGFEFFTGLACVFPMLALYALKTRFRRLSVLLLSLVLLGILFSAYTLVILFTGLGLAAMLLYALFRLKGTELKRLASLCLVLLVLIGLFLGVGRLIPLQQSHLYLVKISDVVVTAADDWFGVRIPPYDPGPEFRHLADQGSSQERMDLYATSVRTVLAHPLSGVGSRVNSNDFSEVGAHSSWLDYPAMFGLPAFALWAAFLVLLARRLHRADCDRAEKAYRMVSFAVYILYGFVNPVIATSVFPVVLLFFTAGRVTVPGERETAQA